MGRGNMPFRGFGWPELVIVLVIVMIIFGVGKLPDIGNAMGKAIREFRKSSSDKAAPEAPDKAEAKSESPSIPE
jgi:sec-independent protein translocase protein TatA